MDSVTRVRAWAQLLKKIRLFMDCRGFCEVTTNHVVPAGAFEHTIDTLKVTYTGGQAELHSSPEMEMKGLLSELGIPIYQICQCFRDDPPSPIHKREFTMLEFYRLNTDYRAIQSDMKDLLCNLAERKLDFEEYTIYELFQLNTGIDLQETLTRETLCKEVKRLNLLVPTENDTWEDIFFKLMLDYIEPKLNRDRPTLVRDYPPQIAALAHINANSCCAEKFEIYWKGMELCNGCTELTDSEELENRIISEALLRNKNKKTPHPLPHRLLTAIDNTLPECAGVAVGLDRLFMSLH